jgi:hypothetical protein
LQALALLNDPQIVEAARHLGQRMLRSGGNTVEQRAGWLFRQVTGRLATPREAAVLARLFEEQRQLFQADPASASRLLGVGEVKNDVTFLPADLAASAVLALAVLNHDEAVMRR